MTPEQINEALLWAKASDIKPQQRGKNLYKDDALLRRLENLITLCKAWAPIEGSTKRTEHVNKLTAWISAQIAKKLRLKQLAAIEFEASLNLDEFPEVNGKPESRVISTSRNIVYLVDRCTDFLEAFEESFGCSQRKKAEGLLQIDLGVLLYVTNSIESGGRAFSGDPFTGQVAAYSRIFTYDLFARRTLNFILYYPHQLYSQFFNGNMAIPINKGVRMLREQATLIISCNGVLINPASWTIV